MAPRTLYQKIWDDHVVNQQEDGTCLLYIDRHLVHEGTSPQAFEALRLTGRSVRRPDLTLAVPDHNLPTTPRLAPDGSRLPGLRGRWASCLPHQRLGGGLRLLRGDGVDPYLLLDGRALKEAYRRKLPVRGLVGWDHSHREGQGEEAARARA